MSYEPTIFVDFADLKALDEKSEKLKSWTFYDNDKPKEKAMGEIRDAYVNACETNPSFHFKGIDFVVIWVEFSTPNLEVRKQLEKLKIPFAIYE